MSDALEFGDALPGLTIAQVAILLHKTTRTVRTYLSRELDPLPADRGKGRKATMIPLAEFIDWLIRERLRDVHVTAEGEVLDLEVERARLAKEQRLLTEQTRQTRAGELVPKHEIVEGFGRLVGHARMHLLSLPQKCAPALAGMTGEGEVFGYLTAEIHEALTRLSRGEPAALIQH